MSLVKIGMPEVFDDLRNKSYDLKKSELLVPEGLSGVRWNIVYGVMTGFEDILGATLGAGTLYNTSGCAHQLMIAAAVCAGEATREVLDQTNGLSMGEIAKEMRKRQILTGSKIIDLACGYPFFGIAAKSLGAEVHTVDGEIQAKQFKTNLNSHTVVDLCSEGVLEQIAETTGGEFDLVTINIVGQVPGARAKLVEPSRESMETLAEQLLKTGGYFHYETVHLMQRVA